MKFTRGTRLVIAGGLQELSGRKIKRGGIMKDGLVLSSFLTRGIRRGSLFFLSFGFALLFLTATSARAQNTLTVTTLGDSSGSCTTPGSSTNCTTLRAAINQANADYATDNAGDTIGFSSTPYGTILLGSTLPAITGTMTIEGPTVTSPGTTEVAISGQNSVELMQVNPGATLTLKYLTLEYGAENYVPTIGDSGGGAIYNQGHLTVDTCWFKGNTAKDQGGAIRNQSVGSTGNPATADIKNSLFSNNSAGFGGAIWNWSGGPSNDTAALNINGSTFSNNSASNEAGAIANDYADLTVTDSSFNSNEAYTYGGAIANFNNPNTANISGSSFSRNYAENGLGGAIYDYNSKADGTTTITQCTFTGNYAEKLYTNKNTLTYTLGGAIYTERASLTVTESTFDSNVAYHYDHFGFNNVKFKTGLGGAIYSLGYTTVNSNSPMTTTTVTKSTFLNNQAFRGGAIYDDSISQGNPKKVTGITFLTNDTFWMNNASNGGGAIYSHSHYSSLYATNDTFAGNSATNGGGIMVANATPANVNIKSSILAAEPTGGNCNLYKTTAITDNGYNISDDGSCNFTLSSNNVPSVGLATDLADNNGPTETVALQPSSPAVDAIPTADCTDQGSWQGTTTLAPPAPIATDQRGVSRPQGSGCDIGAYELNNADNSPPNITITSPTATTYIINQQVQAIYTCTPDDEETGDILSCSATVTTGSTSTEPVASGNDIYTSTVGPETFTVTAKDNDSSNNTSTQPVEYYVKYGICSLNNTGISVVSGAVVPIKLQLCDANGENLSSPGITVHATGVYLEPTGPMSDVQNAGNSNPGGDFRYSAALGGGTGGYIYNLMTTNYTAGTYELDFTVEGDATTTYYVEFQVTN